MAQGLFNFKPSVRPVPLDCHIQGYPGKFYCPRMATMNKPAYAAIQTYAPTKPTLVFVSSRSAPFLSATTRFLVLGPTSLSASQFFNCHALFSRSW